MADDNTIIEGNVKFRDGKKWKSRWCVMRRLSPVADSVQLEVWGEAGPRRGGGGGALKAALALEQYLGCEAGFTLDRHSHTLALVCRDVVAVLAFESRERLMQWQVKARGALGAGRQHSAVVARGGVLPPGPVRLLLRDGRFALTAGVPPRLLGVWELHHLRRYGVVDGRFCFEGGSLCGRGEGLHVLVSDRASDIARDFELAARGRLEPARRPTLTRDGDRLPGGHASRAALALDLADTASLRGEPAEGVALARCVSCMSKLGALSRSSTAALTPGARHFSPAWTMEALRPPKPPPRPPKPPALTPPPPAPCQDSPAAPADGSSLSNSNPYDNYDVPRTPFTEIELENYDTPKRLKECIESDLFKITKNCSADAMILKKSCGCLLRFGRRHREPMVVDVDENFQPSNCPCRRVTDWANDWIKFPYCRRKTTDDDTAIRVDDDRTALYATVDVSRKSKRRTTGGSEQEIEPHSVEIDEGPLANYENLNFALSLEHYENARDMLRRAGVTQAELNALGATLRRGTRTLLAADYLLMAPDRDPRRAPPAGYTPMSPVGTFAFHTLRRRTTECAPALGDQKSASNPALGDALSPCEPAAASDEAPRRRRSNSADSSRFLEDVIEFDGGSSSSLETLRAGGGAGRAERQAQPATRDSSSSADSGVSSCELRGPPGATRHFELPATTSAARRQWAGARRAAATEGGVARRSRSAGADSPPQLESACAKSSSAEAEVPLLRLLRGAVGTAADARSSSSGASDMSDYIETLSLCSSHSSTDTPVTLRWVAAVRRVRPRSAGEYRPVLPRSAGEYRPVLPRRAPPHYPEPP